MDGAALRNPAEGRIARCAADYGPAGQSSSIDNYLRLTALLYLFIGLFIFVRRWNAPRAIHFYIFCLASFILYSFHYSGKLNSFDWIIYWGNAVALLLQPALLLHFALVFPERRGTFWRKLAPLGVYSVPAILLALQIFVATGTLDFMPSISSRQFLDQIDLLYLGAYFLLAAGVFLASYFAAPSGVLRQQLKWVTGGTIRGNHSGSRAVHLALPVLDRSPVLDEAFRVFAGADPALLRLRRDSLPADGRRHHLQARAGLHVRDGRRRYDLFRGHCSDRRTLPHRVADGPGGAIIAIVVAAFLFQPLRDWVQARLDHFFYRDRLDYRRTLIEFGRALTNEVRVEPLMASVLDRVSQTLLVDRLAVFLEDAARPGEFVLSRSIGIPSEGPLDLRFLDPARPALANGCLFFESARAATEESESARGTIEKLGLNYFIPCRFHDHAPAILGLGKTVDGDYLSSEDLELLSTIAGYVAIAVENARLYQSLEQKALQIERLKDFNENIVESLRIGVLTADLEDRIESWNPQLEDLLEVPRTDAIGRRIDEVLPRDLSGEIFAHAAAEHVSGIYKFHLTMRSGKHLVVNASVAPLLGKNGARLGRLVLLDDITQRVRLEDQMVQTEKLTSLGLLAAGVAHEVNTPLAVISNYIQMLAKQIPADDPRQKTIERIVKQTFRASEIVNNLLNFSRTGGAEPVDVDLNAVLEETLTLVQHPFRAASISVVRNYAERLPAVLGSTTRLQQVFLNLFMNARDAMPGGGMLEVRTGAHNGSVEVEVVDTGAGIPAEHLHRIFDPFFTTKATGRGTGLGLSVSYGIIKEHAGKVDVRSTPGKGTSFRLEFPVARKAVHA